MGVNDGLLDVAKAVGVFQPFEVEDDGRFFTVAVVALAVCYLFAFIACGFMGWILYQDGWI